MKKVLYLAVAIVFVAVLAACDAKTNDEYTIVVGASITPHAEILKEAKSLLKEKGYTLVIKEYQDYILPNRNLTDGELDANYFQHIPYLTSYNADNQTNIVNAGGIHIEPIGIYSKSFSSVEQLDDSTTIIMSNSVADQPRLLSLLIQEGLIVLDEEVNLASLDVRSLNGDSVRNPKGFTFRNDIDPGLLVTTYKTEKNVAVLINTNFALDGGLKPLQDALALEEGNADNPYVNIIAVKSGDENSTKIEALIEVLKSEEIKQFILEKYQGAVIPAN
jgi:D-methionine transport system substrate-binding protein